MSTSYLKIFTNKIRIRTNKIRIRTNKIRTSTSTKKLKIKNQNYNSIHKTKFFNLGVVVAQWVFYGKVLIFHPERS
jgi:hypothetical protein